MGVVGSQFAAVSGTRYLRVDAKLMLSPRPNLTRRSIAANTFLNLSPRPNLTRRSFSAHAFLKLLQRFPDRLLNGFHTIRAKLKMQTEHYLELADLSEQDIKLVKFSSNEPNLDVYFKDSRLITVSFARVMRTGEQIVGLRQECFCPRGTDPVPIKAVPLAFIAGNDYINLRLNGKRQDSVYQVNVQAITSRGNKVSFTFTFGVR